MGMEVGCYRERVELPKLGPSLLIASALILAIHTAKWPADYDARLSNKNLEKEIDFAIGQANSVPSKLLTKQESLFSQRREP